MKKAIFFDRDGTINRAVDKYYIWRSEDFKINKGIVESLQKFRDNGFIFIIISNQSGIAKNEYSVQDTENVHEYLISKLKNKGIEIAEIYYCPHHPDHSGKCLCRKPGSLLIEKAIARFHIDPSKSFLIGDSERDIEAGEKAGIRGILIKQNENILPCCKKILKGKI
ncbi:MAG: HAD family hydrolase [Bacteroidia bacterium]|nr:HAD family hydrolase [Bacteroidia bacterium]